MRSFLRVLQGKVSSHRRFRDQCDAAFDEVDHNATGGLDATELHLVVLLFFDKLNATLGKKHVRPPSRGELFEMFRRMDTDKSGELSKEEFHALMAELCEDVSTGVALDALKSFVLVPAGLFLFRRTLETSLPGVNRRFNEAGPLGAAAASMGVSVLVDKIPGLSA